MQWRLRVEEISLFPNDPSVAVVSEGARMIGLAFERARVRTSELLYFGFEPDVFHNFEIRSHDMYSYKLRIDGVLVHNGAFVQAVGPAFVAWGDGGYLAGSRSTWDYFRFGVIPEPATAAGVLVLGIAGPVWFRVRKRG